jgi:hypothetical protein
MPNSTEKGIKELVKIGALNDIINEMYLDCKKSKNTDSAECHDYYLYQMYYNLDGK